MVNLKQFFKKRPLSWSCLSSFMYNPDEWYRKYILGEKTPPNKYMLFGSEFGRSVEARKPLAKVEIYEDTEYPLKFTFAGIPCIGFIDTYSRKKNALREYKTAQTVWTKEKAQNHGQLKFYALGLFTQEKVRPELLTVHLDCIETEENFYTGTISFVNPDVVHSHRVVITMADVLNFGKFIKETVKQMQKYCDEHEI